jgi:hypothetical protein
MNTSRRVPGVSRNSGWQAVDIEIASRRPSRPETPTVYSAGTGK